MNVQVLLATMNQKDFSLLEKMNIQTDAIVGNQCDKNEILEFDYNGKNIKWLSLAERGVGLNRNNCLMRATGDICLFADDDVVYDNGYEKIITDFYAKNPKADVVVFNFSVSRDGETFVDEVTKTKKLKWNNVLKYGAYAITARVDKLKFFNINFNRCFGGGTEHSCGEDTLFLSDCYKSGLQIYSCKEKIGTVKHNDSTWFNGYTDKYFFDKGVLFSLLNKNFSAIFSLYHCFKHRNKFAEYGWLNAYKMMLKGIKSAKNKFNKD